ncbi:MAG: FAD-dependent monooxygenase, partial [Actinomycetota bacterium]|nr:FAD-dependent monooxygenase [Actinomycetota bacterium]
AVVLDDTVRARVVIGADGVRSVVRGALGVPSRGQTALAIRGYAPTRAAHRGRQVIRWGTRPQPSYAWAFDRGDGFSNIGYGELAHAPGLTRRLLLDELERLLPGVGDGAGSWRAHHLPLSARGWGPEQPDGPVLLTGDAAGLVNPLTGEGIYYAVATGSLAGAAAVQALAAGCTSTAGARHRDAVRRLLDHHLRHTWAASRLSRVRGVVDAGLGASGNDQGVFDDLVELGLGDGLLTPRLVGGLARGLLGQALTTPLPRSSPNPGHSTLRRTS